MPDDYPRDAWLPSAVEQNLEDWEDLLEETGLAVGPRRNPHQLMSPRGPAFGPQARKEGIKPLSYKGIRLDPEVETTNRRQLREMLRLLDDKGIKKLIRAHLHFGNRKLPECYLVFNLNPAHQCPSLMNSHGSPFRFRRDKAPDAEQSYCQAFDAEGNLVCYAWAAELGYKDCFPYRVRQNELWRQLIVNEPEWLIEVVTDIHDQYREKAPIVAFRWSEAGDIEDQESLDAIMEISSGLSGLWAPKKIRTELYDDHEIPATMELDSRGKPIKGSGVIKKAGVYTFPWPGKFVSFLYSARQDLDFSGARENGLVVLGSDWEDQHAPGISGQFKMVYHVDDPPAKSGKQWDICPMKCRLCQRCPQGLNTKVLNH